MQIFTDTYYYRPYSLNYSHIHLCQANINTQILVLTQYLWNDDGNDFALWNILTAHWSVFRVVCKTNVDTAPITISICPSCTVLQQQAYNPMLASSFLLTIVGVWRHYLWCIILLKIIAILHVMSSWLPWSCTWIITHHSMILVTVKYRMQEPLFSFFSLTR